MKILKRFSSLPTSVQNRTGGESVSVRYRSPAPSSRNLGPLQNVFGDDDLGVPQDKYNEGKEVENAKEAKEAKEARGRRKSNSK